MLLAWNFNNNFPRRSSCDLRVHIFPLLSVLVYAVPKPSVLDLGSCCITRNLCSRQVEVEKSLRVTSNAARTLMLSRSPFHGALTLASNECPWSSTRLNSVLGRLSLWVADLEFENCHCCIFSTAASLRSVSSRMQLPTSSSARENKINALGGSLGFYVRPYPFCVYYLLAHQLNPMIVNNYAVSVHTILVYRF